MVHKKHNDICKHTTVHFFFNNLTSAAKKARHDQSVGVCGQLSGERRGRELDGPPAVVQSPWIPKFGRRKAVPQDHAAKRFPQQLVGAVPLLPGIPQSGCICERCHRIILFFNYKFGAPRGVF